VSSKGFPRNPSPDRNLERQQIDNILHHAKKWVFIVDDVFSRDVLWNKSGENLK
jgi:hypothetical protein